MKLTIDTENRIILLGAEGEQLAAIPFPVVLEGFTGDPKEEAVRLACGYTRILSPQENRMTAENRMTEENRITAQNRITAEARIVDPAFGELLVTDTYIIGSGQQEQENGVSNREDEKSCARFCNRSCDGPVCGGDLALHRRLEVRKAGTLAGIRLLYEMELFPEEAPCFGDLRYFAPPAIYDKNDLDEDGVEDYFHTQKTIYRDDRLNYPMFMAWNENKKTAFRVERDQLPAWDSSPVREKDPLTGEKAPLFLQKTDIGSMGVDGKGGRPVRMTACYPFFEGDATIGLYIIKTVPFGAFWPLADGEELEVSYRIGASAHMDFMEACWHGVARVIREKKPQAAPLAVSSKELVDYRLKALDLYYVEKIGAEDENQPAGYVLNCHPQDGKQLENIIQYGFTGQNMLNAYNMLRYGYQTDNPEYRRKALKTADFFAHVIHIPESGMFYNLYNIDTKQVNFWWTGLLLPLAYARNEELSGLMGPLYEYRKEVIDTLSRCKGAYLRCMNEDVISLLSLYRLELEKGREHADWRLAIENYGAFLLRTQEEDGSWYRAYDLEGKPVTEPELWFGGTVYEKKSSTGTSIALLVELYRTTGDEGYLKAAERAGAFVKSYIIDRVRFNGGVHDSIYAKGQLIDNESILYPMFGMLSLYEQTGKAVWLEGALRAARLTASWVCLWNVPLPEDSTLFSYGFNSIGMGACDTCGCGYVHPFQLMCVAELAQIAIYAGDRELFETARLYWLGCNQTVSLPGKDWGYAAYGLQEEGYLVSWWAVDDPMFSADTGFGHRLKGEGNKTCFPWINAVGVKAYWSLTDRFGTTDFDRIFTEHFT